MDELKLMEDYFWILENCQDPDTAFDDNPTEKEFASLWLCKLCNDIYRGLDAKRLRNMYLLELSKCIHNVELSKTFMQLPPKGPLPPIEGASNIKIDHKTIVHEMKVAAEDYIPLVSPTNYHTHMRTKIFDDNRGACAYVAVALGDPKKGPVWMQMGGNKPYCQSINSGERSSECRQPPTNACPRAPPIACRQGPSNRFRQAPPNVCRNNRPTTSNACRNNRPATPSSSEAEDMTDVNVTFGEFCLDAIAKELAGHAQPEECPQLETQIEKYANFIKNYPIGEEAKHLQGSKLRLFLLLNLQTDLIQALEGCS